MPTTISVSRMTHKKLGQLIAAACKKGTSIYEIADKAGVHYEVINKLRNGNYNSSPSVDNSQAILKAVGHGLYVGDDRLTTAFLSRSIAQACRAGEGVCSIAERSNVTRVLISLLRHRKYGSSPSLENAESILRTLGLKVRIEKLPAKATKKKKAARAKAKR